MIFSAHYPKASFDRQALLAMPVYEKGTFASAGYHRTTDDRGKPLVFFVPEYETDGPGGAIKRLGVHFVVRPVVRVPMGRRAS